MQSNFPRPGRSTRDLLPRGWRRAIAATMLCGLLWGGLLQSCSNSDEDPPAEDLETAYNVVLICLDTVRYDTFWLPEESRPSAGSADWSGRALKFRRALAPAPWTLPSVASVMTGLYPRLHGAGRFAEALANLDSQVPSALPREATVLAEVLEDSGAKTAAFVAHPWFGRRFRLGKGFDRLVIDGGHGKILEKAQDWVSRVRARDSTQPFFLYLHFMEAHEMHRADLSAVKQHAASVPEPLRSQAMAAAPGGACTIASSERCQRFLAYVAAVGMLRQTVVDLLEFLADEGLMGDTVVLLYSDHGEAFDDHSRVETEWRADPRGFYGVGHGQSLFQELLHVPLLMWHPELEGRDVDTPVSLIDLFPTIVEAARATVGDPPERGLGVDLVELASRGSGPSLARPLLASGISYGPEQSAVVRWPWKLIVRTNVRPKKRLLFDLAGDPGEDHPLASPAESVEDLDRLIERYASLSPATAHEAPRLDEEELARLRSLGYLGRAKSDGP